MSRCARCEGLMDDPSTSPDKDYCKGCYIILTQLTKSPLKNDNERLRKLVAGAILNRSHFFPKSTFNWVAVRDMFGVGSTTANRLCLEFGIDPHNEVQDK